MQLSETTFQLVRTGAIDLNDFLRETRPEFVVIAHAMLARRFRGLYTLEVDDLVQIMQLSVTRSLKVWDPGLGYPLRKFALWHARNDAGKVCRRQYALMKVVMLPPARALEVAGEIPTEPWQELELEVVETLRDLPTNRRQVEVLNSVFATQCVERSLDELMADRKTLLMFGADRETARRGIYRTVITLTKRAEKLAR